ncbi:hypothetical protein ASE37_22990 [Rhizobium sp. Root268]|nr:hypothetical protein ASC86_21945 [Rhizobium sp. Root1212]KRD31623.1 hypothetical protein ASE37_22990 [Rhizobium sp. Root268]
MPRNAGTGRRPSERRLDLCVAVQVGGRDGQFRLGDFEFDLDLAALGGIACIAQLRSKFFDLDFERLGYLRLLDVCER